MVRSVRAVLGLTAAIGIASCAAAGKPKPPSPPSPEIAPPLTVVPGIPVLGRAAMPPGWEPLPFRPPLWLRNGQEIAILGSFGGRTMLLGFDAPDLRRSRVLASDQVGPGRLVADIAVSPHTTSIAIAYIRPGENLLEVVRRDLSDDRERTIASLDGRFETVSLAWPDARTIALAATALPSESSGEAPKPDGAGSFLYLTASDGSGVPERIQLNCALSRLSWSPGGEYAIGQGDTGVPPIIIDRSKKTCRPLDVGTPIRVVEWAPKSAAFIYVAPIAGGSMTGTFQFDLASGKTIPIAVSSSAASYLTDSTIAAIGNRGLTAQRLLEQPRVWTTAEIATIDPAHAQTSIATLGVRTLSDLLALSAMVYSRRSDTAVIDLYTPGADEAIRDFIAYPLATRKAVLLAQGPARGVAEMAWSPDGDAVALLVGDSIRSEVIILSPVSTTDTAPAPRESDRPGAVESPPANPEDTAPATP